jgi:hypothetical protein
MSQFPIVSQEGLFEAVNYLASGPSGLGQNFSGFSAYEPAWLSGTFRQPFTTAVSTTTQAPLWYVAPVPVSSVSLLDNNTATSTVTIQWNFTSPQASPPFAVGQRPIGDDTWVPDFYQGKDGYVISCSTTSVVTQLALNNPITSLAPVTTYGSLYINNDYTVTGSPVSTDANARVTVTGPTEQVFISSQLALTSGYSCTTASSFSVTVQINRYSAFLDTTRPGANDYLFGFDKTLSQQTNSFTVSPGTGTVNCGQNIFTTVIDQPNFGYYWYIAEVVWSSITGDVVPDVQTVGLRSLTAQVIKQ